MAAVTELEELVHARYSEAPSVRHQREPLGS